MKKVISTIVAVVFISSMLANAAYAGDRHGGGINPLWVSVAIMSTIAAVAIAQPQHVVYENRVEYEPRQTVVYEEPQHRRHSHYYERDRDYDAPRYRDYR